MYTQTPKPEEEVKLSVHQKKQMLLLLLQDETEGDGI